MRIQLSILFFIVSIVSITCFVCPAINGTYPHEWNKAAYYRCSRECAYKESCPSNSYYSSQTNQCELEPADWSPRFDLTGRYQWPSSYIFMEIYQVGYDIQWTSEQTDAKITFVGRYINETTVTGLQTLVMKTTNCILLQDFDLSVLGKRNFCRSQVAIHWYTRTCDQPLSERYCHVY